MKKKTKPKKKKTKRQKKRSSKKGILITFVIVVAIIGAGVFYFLTNLNFIVKMAIEKFGSEATKTAVRVSNVKISLRDGSGAIRGLTVANPKGFDTRHAFSLGEIGTKIDIKSITEDVKVIDDIIIRVPEIFVEINRDKKNNLNELQKNMAARAPDKQSTSKAKQKKKGQDPKLIIRRFRFSEGNIHAKVVPLNKEYQLKLPSFEMRNIGSQTGATPQQITKQVITELTSRVLVEVRRKGIGQGVGQLTDKAKSELKTQQQKTKNQLKGLLNK